MIYRRGVQVEFNHCDPAGIVFYPRYFEMVNSVVENFFAEALGYSFRRIHLDAGCGVPTVHLEADFHAPARLGECLDFILAVDHIGTSSLRLTIGATHEAKARIGVKSTLVWIGPDGESAPWPREIRERLTRFGKESEGGQNKWPPGTTDAANTNERK
jgi:4-hydroxybenzoyl-CoA thioesterase